MGDIQDDLALIAQLANDPKQLLYLAGRQAAGRLVKGDDMRIPGQGLGDLHHLPLAQRQVFEGRLGRHIHAEARQLSGRIPVQFFPIDDTVPSGQLAQIDVLGDGHLGDQMQLLVNDGDPALQRIDRVLKHPLLAIQLHHPCGGGLKAAQYLEQGGFARAVFAHQRMHCAPVTGKGDVLQRLDARKLLADAAKLQIRN